MKGEMQTNPILIFVGDILWLRSLESRWMCWRLVVSCSLSHFKTKNRKILPTVCTSQPLSGINFQIDHCEGDTACDYWHPKIIFGISLSIMFLWLRMIRLALYYLYYRCGARWDLPWNETSICHGSLYQIYSHISNLHYSVHVHVVLLHITVEMNYIKQT